MFADWLRENANNKLLLLVHPHFAVELWGRKEQRQQLSAYYERVKHAVDTFDGDVIITLAVPFFHMRMSFKEKGWEPDNFDLYEGMLDYIDRCRARKIDDKGDGVELCRTPQELIPYQEIHVGGGYIELCLKETLERLKKVYHKDVQYMNELMFGIRS